MQTHRDTRRKRPRELLFRSGRTSNIKSKTEDKNGKEEDKKKTTNGGSRDECLLISLVNHLDAGKRVSYVKEERTETRGK